MFFKDPLQAALGVIEAWLGLEQEQNETFELWALLYLPSSRYRRLKTAFCVPNQTSVDLSNFTSSVVSYFFT